MSKVEIRTPTPEMQAKIHRAMKAIRKLDKRTLSCPYCHHNTINVFSDARGHVENKCTFCKKEVVVDLVNMRCHRGLSPYAKGKRK